MKPIAFWIAVAAVTFSVGTLAAFTHFDLALRGDYGVETVVPVTPASLSSEEDESLQVYSAILRERYGGDHVVVNDHTSRGGLLADSALDNAADVDASTRESYYRNNERERSLREVFGDASNIVFRTEKEPARHPKGRGIISFSAVGFNPDHTQALVNVVFTCGGQCGSVYLLLLKKANGHWFIAENLGGAIF